MHSYFNIRSRQCYSSSQRNLPPSLLTVHLFLDRCQAGFPSPAQDYAEVELDLNDYCIQRRSSTFFVPAIGNSMTDISLQGGDFMIVDKVETPQHGDIVIAEVEGKFTVKCLLLTPDLPFNP